MQKKGWVQCGLHVMHYLEEEARLLLGQGKAAAGFPDAQVVQASLQSLIPIIRREEAHLALRSLHLVHCKITAKVTHSLLNSLNQQKNRIRNLSLVNVNLNQSNYLALCQLIRVSRSLQDLDISWNGMQPKQMYELIDVIVENRSLQFLNLSYNNLHDPL